MTSPLRAVLLVPLLAVAGCSSAVGRSAPSPVPIEVAKASGYAAVSPRGVSGERVIVRTAALTVGVPQIPPARERAIATVQQHGGRLDRDTGTDDYAMLRFRVPDAQLEVVADQLAALGDVESRSSGAEDRSVEAADLDARVTNLRASRDRLRALAERAESVADVVAVERELTRVQGELDSLEAQLRVLRDQAAMATLDLHLRRQVTLGPLGWLLKGTGALLTKLFVWR